VILVLLVYAKIDVSSACDWGLGIDMVRRRVLKQQVWGYLLDFEVVFYTDVIRGLVCLDDVFWTILTHDMRSDCCVFRNIGW
jgi:hypothetical protein